MSMTGVSTILLKTLLAFGVVLFCPDLVSSTIAPSSLTELLPLELLVFWQIRAGELLVGAATLRSSEHFVLLQNQILGKLHGVIYYDDYDEKEQVF
jgi:hypothetical protein